MSFKNFFAISIISAISLGSVAAHFDLLEGKLMIFIISLGSSLFIFILLFLYERSLFFPFIIFWIVLAHFISGMVIINCFFDNSEPIIIHEEISNKEIVTSHKKSGRNRSRSFKLIFENDAIKDISVSRELYNSLNKGDYVNIYTKEGFLGFSWYYVEDDGLLIDKTL